MACRWCLVCFSSNPSRYVWYGVFYTLHWSMRKEGRISRVGVKSIDTGRNTECEGTFLDHNWHWGAKAWGAKLIRYRCSPRSQRCCIPFREVKTTKRSVCNILLQINCVRTHNMHILLKRYQFNFVNDTLNSQNWIVRVRSAMHFFIRKMQF